MGSFRRFKDRYLPFLPAGSQTRRWRNKFLRKFGLTRAYDPAVLTERPEFRYGSLLPLVVAEHVLERGELTFLQIGAFDGQVGDEIFELIQRFPVRGVLVEPQPSAFEKLKALHGERDNLLLINGAIDRTTCMRPFYMSRKGDVEFASFDRSHLVRHGLASQEIVSQETSCLTVDDVLRLANLDTVDLLQIDAEGYDYEILKSIDFDRVCPRIIRFEYRHFSGGDLRECLETLADRGYRFLIEKLDVIAVLDKKAPNENRGQGTAPSYEDPGPSLRAAEFLTKS